MGNTNTGDNMKIRLGYACISETIIGTSSSTYPYTKYKEEQDNKNPLV